MKPTNEQLPDYNPVKVCNRCETIHLTWKLTATITDGIFRVRHNFCPTITRDGKIIDLCMECKMAERGTLCGEAVR